MCLSNHWCLLNHSIVTSVYLIGLETIMINWYTIWISTLHNILRLPENLANRLPTAECECVLCSVKLRYLVTTLLHDASGDTAGGGARAWWSHRQFYITWNNHEKCYTHVIWYKYSECSFDIDKYSVRYKGFELGWVCRPNSLIHNQGTHLKKRSQRVISVYVHW